MGRLGGFINRAALALGLCVCGSLLAPAACLAGAPPGLSLQQSGTRADLRAVALVGQHGWAVGASGTLITTSDGGATWAPLAGGSGAWLVGAAFADPLHGWVSANSTSTPILATGDGGATWQPQPAPAVTAGAVDAVDTSHAWALVSTGVAATTDGATWKARAVPGGGSLLGLDAVDRDHVWAVGQGGRIVATPDGGATWLMQHMDPALTLTTVSFIDDLHGWAAGYSGGGMFGTRAVLLATDDGGVTWTTCLAAASQSFFTGLVRGDALHGWAVGCYGAVPQAVFATADGGATWKLTAVAPHLLAAVAADNGAVCAVGDGGTVLAGNGAPSSDATPPQVSVAGAGAGWRTSWVLRLSATDQGGAGVAMRQYSVGPDRWRRGEKVVLRPASDHAFDGAHRVYYRAVDAAGNVAPARSVVVHIDSRSPRTQAPASVRAVSGARCSLPFTVRDPKPCAGWARVTATFVAGDAAGNEHVVKVVALGRVADGWHVLRFRCDLPRGTYICSIAARDAAGNVGGGNATLVHVR